MSNRRPQMGGSGGRRMDFQRNDQRKNFGRSGVSPWQGGGPGGAGLPNLLPLGAGTGGGSTEATLALASNILNLLQPRQNPVPSLLDMPIRREFVPNMGRFDRNFPHQRMGNQGNFRRTGNYNRAGERINHNRKQFKPNDGPRQQNKSSPKKDADSKSKPVKESELEDKSDSQDQEMRTDDSKDLPRTRYDEVHPSLLKCHICNKSMWDGRSFENHLSGRAHAIMMQKTAESYALTADTMRQEFKIREMKRTRKSGQQPTRDFYCAMCDMYAADGGVHRTTVGHRKLKKYLHPTCTSCHKEMPTRIELDEHRLTAEHLKNMQEKQEDITKPKPEVLVISTVTMEQTFLREDRQRKRRDLKERTQADAVAAATKDESISIKQEPGDGEGEFEKPSRMSWDTDKTVIDYPEGYDLSNITPDMLPAYSTERGVGASFLAEFKCVQCRLCNKLLDNQETAQVHLRTWKHHQLFVKSLQPHPPLPPKEEFEVGTKRPHGSSDDGNWKRRRADTDNDADNDADNDYADNDADVAADTVRNVEIKSEPQENEAVENDAGTVTPRPEELENCREDYEDWEQSVDEILDDEKNRSNDDKPEEREEPPEAAPTESIPIPECTPAPAELPPLPAAPPTPAVDDKPRSSPRRGRGRGRGRVWN